MALTINSNIASLTARNALNNTTSALGRNFQRLASGLRINSAKDDPAGIGIATRMTSKIRGLNVAKSNANDGLSLAQVADSALEETTNALQNIRDLATEASTGTKSSGDREALKNEVDAMIAEITRIATETEMFDIDLLTGAFAETFQIGPNTDDTLAVTIAGASLEVLALGEGGSKMNVSTQGSATAAIAAVDIALDSVASIRGSLGGLQSRFESIINTIESSVVSYTSARSQIMDADIATETASMTRNVILQQAGAAVLAQANLQPQLLLKLLSS